MLQTNQYSQSMEGSRTKAEYSGIALKPVARGIYETVNSGVWKTLHVIPHTSTKVGGNKIRGYTSAYAPQIDCNKTAET